MAWRLMRYLRQGELDNTIPGKVTGWMEFAGRKKTTFDLKGDFHRDIRGTRICFTGDGNPRDTQGARHHMQGFAKHQTGRAGEITIGRPPSSYAVGHPYIEIYSDQHGRMVIELEPAQLTVLGTLRPFLDAEPVRREQQNISEMAKRGDIRSIQLLAESCSNLQL